ncbi:MAG: OmpH family outer membrane protein [Bacteroidales bacterium]|nr:OmpH family outer membrane protein [Bacteroidales bacterium]
MKNINLITNGVLLVAVIVLFALHFSNHEKSEVQGELITVGDSVKYAKLPIAYINVDSLLTNYNFAKDLNEALLRKQENSRASLNEKAKVLQGEMADFQKKVENNAFLSRERAENEQRRLMGKQQELQQMEQRLSSELMVQQQKMNEQLRDTVNAFLKEYNKEKGYHLILSNTMFDNVLYAKDSYNITNDVIEKLNARYTSKK